MTTSSLSNPVLVLPQDGGTIKARLSNRSKRSDRALYGAQKTDNNRARATKPWRIFELIREEIVSGRLAQGAKVVEADFAKRFATSRGPLREALHKLEQINLITRTPHTGSTVTTLTTAIMREAYQMREALEGFAARLCAENMSDAAIFEVEALLAAHGKKIEESGGTSYVQEEGDLDFHYSIFSQCGNAMLADFLNDKVYHITRMCRHRASHMHNRAKIGFREHQNIVRAIKARDGEFAEILMRRHVAGAWRSIKTLLDNDQLANLADAARA